jgi:predicted site-specific integrase-resolvase
MSAPIQTQPRWVSGRKARERLNVSVAGLYKLAARGEIQIKAEPGETVRYSAADVERLAEERGKSD